MSDKPGKIGGKKVGGIKQPTSAEGVDEAGEVSDVGGVKKTAGVGGVSSAAGAGRRSTRPMTIAEREKLFGMIEEEADKMFKKGDMTAEQKKVIREAVKMAVDSGLAEEEEEESDKKQDSPEKKKK